MMQTAELTKIELEGIQEIGNIGAGQAAQTLSEEVDQPVDIGVPEADIITLPDTVTDTPSLFDEFMGSHLVGVYVPTTGLAGGAFISFTRDDCLHFMSAVMDEDVDGIGDDEKQQLTRIGESLVEAYLRSAESLLSVSIGHEPGRTVSMPADTLTAHIASTVYPETDSDPDVLAVKTRFSIEDVADGYILLMLQANETGALVDAIHETLGS